ncbi:MAG TPA: nuclear transport factor 2 family protein [Fimbriimonadaceae bacterium]|nr:nuclear transport factor 2 family protein [Fimbriimonadaceae bacterium]
MKTRLLVAVLGAFALVAFAPAENLRKIADQHAREFVQALKTKNASWFERVAAPDYFEIGTNGKRTDRATAMKEMQQMFAAGKVTDASSTVLKVTGSGSKMVVTVKAHVAMSVKFDPKAKKPSKMVSDVQMEEHWSKDGGKWMIHELKTLKEKNTLNGKPMPSQM